MHAQSATSQKTRIKGVMTFLSERTLTPQMIAGRRIARQGSRFRPIRSGWCGFAPIQPGPWVSDFTSVNRAEVIGCSEPVRQKEE